MTSKICIWKVPSTSEGKDKTRDDDAEGSILTLRHPKSAKFYKYVAEKTANGSFFLNSSSLNINVSTSYVFKSGFLQELHWFKQSYGSWFLGDHVCEDGSLYLSTPVDPIFIFLPIFADARMKKGTDLGMFRQLDEILYVEGYPGYRHLIPMAEDSMQLVCDMKEVGSSKFFRLDDSKVLSWLCCKVLHLKASLLKLDKNYAIQDEKETLKEIVTILGEYLKDDPWLALLCNHLKLNLEEALQKASKNESDLGFLENTPVSSRPPLGKADAGKTKSSNARQSKRLKTETDSQNIKDMFRRVSTRKH